MEEWEDEFARDRDDEVERLRRRKITMAAIRRVLGRLPVLVRPPAPFRDEMERNASERAKFPAETPTPKCFDSAAEAQEWRAAMLAGEPFVPKVKESKAPYTKAMARRDRERKRA